MGRSTKIAYQDLRDIADWNVRASDSGVLLVPWKKDELRAENGYLWRLDGVMGGIWLSKGCATWTCGRGFVVLLECQLWKLLHADAAIELYLLCDRSNQTGAKSALEDVSGGACSRGGVLLAPWKEAELSEQNVYLWKLHGMTGGMWLRARSKGSFTDNIAAGDVFGGAGRAPAVFDRVMCLKEVWIQKNSAIGKVRRAEKFKRPDGFSMARCWQRDPWERGNCGVRSSERGAVCGAP